MTDRRVDIEQALESCLEQIKSGHESIDSALTKYPDYAQELRPQLETALWLGEHKASLDPRPGFVSASRSRLISKIQEEIKNPIAQENVPELDLWMRIQTLLIDYRRHALHLAFSVIMLVILVYGGNRITNNVQNAIPGDKEYTEKIVLEEAELESNSDPVEQTRLHTEFAQTRLVETHDLVMEGRYDYIPETIDRFEYHVDEAIKSLNQLARQDVNQTEVLGATLHNVLVNQTPSLIVIEAVVPQRYKLEIERAVSISDKGIFLVERLLVSVNRPITPTPPDPFATRDPSESGLFGARTATQTLSAMQSMVTRTYLPLWTSTATTSANRSQNATPRPAILKTTTQPTSAPTERYEPPTKTPTRTPTPTRTSTLTKTPTLTKSPTPTNTPVTPTKTPTPVTPTNTPIPPTITPVQATDAAQDPTQTSIPPSETPVPPSGQETQAP